MNQSSALYGKSFYDLAKEEKITKEVLEEMELVKALFKENPDYIRLLLEPSIPKKERLSLLDQAFSEELQPYLLNFLKVLLEKGLLRSYSECYKTYKKRYQEDEGITDALVVSAVALSEEQKAALITKLEKLCQKKIILSEKIDPEVLGGLKVEVDGKTLDGTVSGRLKEIRKNVNEVVL